MAAGVAAPMLCYSMCRDGTALATWRSQCWGKGSDILLIYYFTNGNIVAFSSNQAFQGFGNWYTSATTRLYLGVNTSLPVAYQPIGIYGQFDAALADPRGPLLGVQGELWLSSTDLSQATCQNPVPSSTWGAVSALCPGGTFCGGGSAATLAQLEQYFYAPAPPPPPNPPPPSPPASPFPPPGGAYFGSTPCANYSVGVNFEWLHANMPGLPAATNPTPLLCYSRCRDGGGASASTVWHTLCNSRGSLALVLYFFSTGAPLVWWQRMPYAAICAHVRIVTPLDVCWRHPARPLRRRHAGLLHRCAVDEPRRLGSANVQLARIPGAQHLLAYGLSSYHLPHLCTGAGSAAPPL